MKDGKLDHVLDGSDESESNWMRFVNLAQTETQQNLNAFQYQGQIYYRVYKNISAGEELLVWYGLKYAKQLGLLETDAATTADDHKGVS